MREIFAIKKNEKYKKRFLILLIHSRLFFILQFREKSQFSRSQKSRHLLFSLARLALKLSSTIKRMTIYTLQTIKISIFITKIDLYLNVRLKAIYYFNFS